jgi:hypothetical protein
MVSKPSRSPAKSPSGAWAHAPRLAEIDVAVQLAHDQDVEPAHFLRLQWGRTDELVIQDRRAQIRE